MSARNVAQFDRQALDAALANNTTPGSLLPPRKQVRLARAKRREAKTANNNEGTLEIAEGRLWVTSLDVLDINGTEQHLVAEFACRQDEDWLSTQMVEAYFYLRSANSFVEIGHISGKTIDKTVRPARRTTNPKQKTMLSWRTDLLIKDKSETEYDHGSDIRGTFRKLYTQRGDIRSDMRYATRHLTGARIHYVDWVEISQDFRGKGLAARAVALYLLGLPKLDAPYGFRGNSLLEAAPVMFKGDDAAWRGLEEVNDSETRSQIISHLERTYARCGFRTFLEEDSEWGITLMARRVEDIGQVEKVWEIVEDDGEIVPVFAVVMDAGDDRIRATQEFGFSHPNSCKAPAVEALSYPVDGGDWVRQDQRMADGGQDADEYDEEDVQSDDSNDGDFESEGETDEDGDHLMN